MSGTHETIPGWVLERTDLSPAAKLVYGYLRPLVEKRWPAAQRLIGTKLGMSKSMVLRAVRELLAAGLVEVEKSSRRGTVYRFGAVRGRTGDDGPCGPSTDRKKGSHRSADGPQEDGASGPSTDPVRSTDGPQERSADGPPAVHGRTASGPSTDQFQTTKPPNPPLSGPHRSVTNFDLLPDPLKERGPVSVEEFTLRLWQRAGQNRGAPPGPLAPHDRQALDDVTAWGRRVAPEVAKARGLTPTEAFRAAVVHSLRAFGEEFDGKLAWAKDRGAPRPAWRATWWRSNLTAYAMGLTTAA